MKNKIKKEYIDLKRERNYWKVKDGSFISSYTLSFIMFIMLFFSNDFSKVFITFLISCSLIIFLKLLNKIRNNNYLKKISIFKEKHNLSEKDFNELK
jgi:uncharacterized membrane protein YjjP (DUF1212 family)